MNLQSRSKRWLAAAELSKSLTAGILESQAAYRAAGNPMPVQAHEMFSTKMLDYLRLTAEAEPLSPDSPLYDVVDNVVRALDGVTPGVKFRAGVQALDTALDEAIATLRDWTAGEDSKIEDIIDELERAFLISLFITLTSHTFVTEWSDKWAEGHEDFLDGKTAQDLLHYVDLPTFLPCKEPGSGRVHVQQLQSAIRAGTTVFIAGAGHSEVDHYPELQSIAYSQWFAYMHAIWDEQFRVRIAAFYSTPEEPLEKNDVLSDFFGDIRRVRNDFVHGKGIADEAVKVKLLDWGFAKGKPLDIQTLQMLSLVGLFPREALMVKPTARPSPGRKSVPGSADIVLVDRFVAKVAELGMDKNDALDQAVINWLAAQ